MRPRFFAFKAYVARTTHPSYPPGSAPLGYRLGRNDGFTWVNVDRITVQFDREVHVEADDLRLWGVNNRLTMPRAVEYTSGDRLYNVSRATFIFDKPLTADRFVLELDGDPGGIYEQTTGAQLDGDENGVDGGDYRANLYVGPGNLYADLVVDAYDARLARNALNTSTSNIGAGDQYYTIDKDVNGDGRINAVDVAEVRRRFGTTIPTDWPPPASVAATAPPARSRPVTRGLFSTDSILA